MQNDPAEHRRGKPEPLILHLSAAAHSYGQALAGAAAIHHPDFPWHPTLQEKAANLAEPETLAVAADVVRRSRLMLEGIETWQRHPFRMPNRRRPVLWRSGSSRLLDYGKRGVNSAPIVLVVPSLINRAYVLDLLPRRSFLRRLAGAGLRPLLLDWGEPDEAEAAFDLDAYGNERLLPALKTANALAGGPVGLVGYCMGGTLSIGLASAFPDAFNALAVIGAPWDFSDDRGVAGTLRSMARNPGQLDFEALLAAQAAAFGLIPTSVFQTLFALLDPFQTAQKFRRFALQDKQSPGAKLFVALEDWLADGVPMAHPAAHDLLIGWHAQNQPARGNWRFLGKTVDPENILCPSAVFHGARDLIAPSALCSPLAGAIPGASEHVIASGHVGMIIGSKAQKQVIEPIAKLMSHAAGA